MPNVSEKKLKLLYLARMLWEKTDGQHAVTLPQMLADLESKGIPAERKSLYDDLETLRRFGFAIETRKSRCFEYYLAQRPFSQEDLTQLAQAVRQATFLTQRKAARLIKKLAALGSQYQGEELLHANGELAGFSAPEDEAAGAGLSVKEVLTLAVERGLQVECQMAHWEVSAGGMVEQSWATVVLNPWHLFQQDGVETLLAFDSETRRLRRIPLCALAQGNLLERPREGALPVGEKLTLEFPQEFLSPVAGHFSGALAVEALGKGRLRATVKAPVDGALFTWLFSMEGNVRLAGPKKVVEQFRDRAKSLAKSYKS